MDFLDALNSFNRPRVVQQTQPPAKKKAPTKSKKVVSKDTVKDEEKEIEQKQTVTEIREEKPKKSKKRPLNVEDVEVVKDVKDAKDVRDVKDNDKVGEIIFADEKPVKRKKTAQKKKEEDEAVFKSPERVRFSVNASIEETPTSQSSFLEDASETSMSLSVTKKPRKTTAQSKLPSHLTKVMVDGITRKQRHNVLNLLNTAVERYKTKVDPCFVYEKEEIVDYMVRLENRVYNSIFLRVMRPCFNMYRYNLYRKTTHELIWSLRRNAKRLLTFPPDLLASLPPKELIRESECAIWYEQYVERQKEIKRREEEVRESKRQIVPEGNFLRCPKCHCLMVLRELQTRRADESSTLFRTCQNCGFTKRN